MKARLFKMKKQDLSYRYPDSFWGICAYFAEVKSKYTCVELQVQ